MHVKNGITVALQVLPIFPLVDTHGQAIEAALETLRTEKSDALTPDLQQGCAGYATQLKKRLRDGRAYVTAAQFHGVSLPDDISVRMSFCGANGVSRAPTRPPHPKPHLLLRVQLSKKTRRESTALRLLRPSLLV